MKVRDQMAIVAEMSELSGQLKSIVSRSTITEERRNCQKMADMLDRWRGALVDAFAEQPGQLVVNNAPAAAIDAKAAAEEIATQFAEGFLDEFAVKRFAEIIEKHAAGVKGGDA